MNSSHTRWVRSTGFAFLAIPVALHVRAPEPPASRVVPCDPEALANITATDLEIPELEPGEPKSTEKPTFHPFDVTPVVQNRDEVRKAVDREYFSTLRGTGIEGRVIVWIYVNEGGVVQNAQVHTSSGNEALDGLAIRVGCVMSFSPAKNRDEIVPVWVAVPVYFRAL